MSTGARQRGRPRDPDADAAILRAALDLFIERDVAGTSIEQVARRAGVGKLTVYRRWDCKEDLIADAIESAREHLPEASEGEPEASEQDSTPLGEQVERWLPELAAASADPWFRALVARVFGSAVSHPRLMATYWEHHVVPRRRATRRLLERAQRAGTLSAEADLDVVLDMMVGSVIYRLVQPGQPDVSEMHRYLREVYRRAGLVQ